MSQVDPIEPNANSAVEVVFSIGSNFSDRHASVSHGIDWLSTFLSDFRHSTIYATPDCHGSNREYLNAVAAGKTIISPEELDSLCKKYEAECGRDENMRKNGDVPVDIDLVVYDNRILRPNDYKREFFQIGYRMI